MSIPIRRSQATNFVAIPHGMLDDLTQALAASGIEVAGVIERPYVQVKSPMRESLMTDLDAAGVRGRRLVVKAAANAGDMRAYVRDRLPNPKTSGSGVAALTPLDEARALNATFSELIDCYDDDVTAGNALAAKGEAHMLRCLWPEYERTMTEAIAYARETDDAPNAAALGLLLENARNRLHPDDQTNDAERMRAGQKR